MADELQGATGTAAPSQSQTPPVVTPPSVETGAAAVAPPVSGGGTAATGGAGGVPGGAQPAINPAAAAQAQNVRDVLGQLGFQGQQFQSDHAALQYLVAQAQQAQQLAQMAPYAQQYMQHAGQFQQWLAQQQQARLTQQQQQAKWFEAPEYDPSWNQKIYRDPQTGELKTVPGTDPSVIQKYIKWTEHQQGFLNRFSQDPLGAIRPGVEQLVREQAQQLFQQQFAAIQEDQQARSFIQQNSEWLHQRDAQGQLVADPRTGQPMLSNVGRVFAQYVREAEQFGLRDSNSQQRYAMTALERDFLRAQMGQGGAAQPTGGLQQTQVAPGDAVKQQFLQQAANAATAAGQAVGQSAQVTAPAGPSVNALREMMARDMAAAGFQPGSVLER